MMANKIIITFFMLCICVWQAHAVVNCTATGAGRYADPDDTTCQNYTLCVFQSTTNTYLAYNYVCPTTSLFSPTLRQCTTTYTCPVNNTATTNTTATTSAATCTADGFVADPNSDNCTSYIECVSINGTFSETTLTCPSSTLYDPDTTLCDSTYVCPNATFTCTSVGRFANTADTTCQSYYYCVALANSTLVEYEYTCPSTSLFDPASGYCTATYTCTN